MTVKFTIDRGVPMPPVRGNKIIYPFDDMEVGDSFFVPNVEHGDITPQIAYRRRTRGWARKFTTRKENGGIRVWRTE